MFPAVCVAIAPPARSGSVRYEHDYITVGINIGGTSVRQADWATLQVKIDDSLKRAIKAMVNFRTSRVKSQWSFWTSVHHRIACRRYATTSSRCFASTRFEQGSRVHDEPAEAPGLQSNVALRQGCAEHRACSRSSMSCMQVPALVTTSLCRIGLRTSSLLLVFTLLFASTRCACTACRVSEDRGY